MHSCIAVTNVIQPSGSTRRKYAHLSFSELAVFSPTPATNYKMHQSDHLVQTNTACIKSKRWRLYPLSKQTSVCLRAATQGETWGGEGGASLIEYWMTRKCWLRYYYYTSFICLLSVLIYFATISSSYSFANSIKSIHLSLSSNAELKSLNGVCLLFGILSTIVCCYL